MPRQIQVAVNQLESDVEVEACKLLLTHLGLKSSKLKILGENGYPDRIIWLPGGKPLMIEYKRPGEDPRPKQIEIHDYLRKLGYHIEVISDAIEALEITIRILAATRLPKESREVLARARMWCVAARSRFGKN